MKQETIPPWFVMWCLWEPRKLFFTTTRTGQQGLHCSSSLAGFMTVINTVARSIKGVNGFYRQLLPSHSAPHVGWDIFLFAICLIILVKCSLDFMDLCVFQSFSWQKCYINNTRIWHRPKENGTLQPTVIGNS